ncbi:hypothetical protein Naga_100032g38 [Nannochloropsis gaditana]|uniref:Cyclin-D1-binding protein 1-like N-terminal domain-containing protein n=1 Tax=Nannochloropsis gaditana TaxID=72520 RepID=W7TY05_9STRA|nr:hypothetical protein Naga_100032g38 [Nannochloropsis gaditana]
MATASFPLVTLEALGRHLSKLRAATTSLPPAPLTSLQWTASPALQDALKLLTDSGDRVRDTATKFSLVLTTTTSGPGIKSICDEMRQSCDSLLAALALLVGPAIGAGGPLMELYCQQVRSILRAIEELLRHIASPDSKLLSAPRPLRSPEGVKDELAPKTGVVWQQCEELKKLPRSNRVAYRRAFLTHQSAVKDTLREFREMLAEAEDDAGTESEEEDDEEEEGEEGGLAGEMADLELEEAFWGENGGGAMREWEKENLSRCLVPLGHCGEMVKGFLEAVEEVAMEGGGRERRREGNTQEKVVGWGS